MENLSSPPCGPCPWVKTCHLRSQAEELSCVNAVWIMSGEDPRLLWPDGEAANLCCQLVRMQEQDAIGSGV